MSRLTKVQKSAQVSILRTIDGANGEVSWGYLHDRGHLFAQIKACENRGLIDAVGSYRWVLTPAGRAALATKENEGHG